MKIFFRMPVRITATRFVELGIIKEWYIGTNVLFVSGSISYSLKLQYHFNLDSYVPIRSTKITILRCRNFDTLIFISEI